MVLGDGGGFVLLLARRGIGEGVLDLYGWLGDRFFLSFEVAFLLQLFPFSE